MRHVCGPQTGRRLMSARVLSMTGRATAGSQSALWIQRQSFHLHKNEATMVTRLRMMSTTTATAGDGETKADGDDKTKDDKKKKKKDEKSNIFLDNLGTAFLSAIGLIVMLLVRSSYGSSNKTKLRELIEEDASLDPLEIDDLRVANCELTPDVFRKLVDAVATDFSQGTCRYEDFVFCVRKKMRELKGDAFTIELGHLLDRAVREALVLQGKQTDDQVSIVFFLTALSLALDLESSTSDRIRVLYEVLEVNGSKVTYDNIVDMVAYLQQTNQLVPDTQVVLGDSKIPVQQYKVASPKELIEWDGTGNDVMDIQAFADILRSKSVCAWGECYFKKKPKL